MRSPFRGIVRGNPVETGGSVTWLGQMTAAGRFALFQNKSRDHPPGGDALHSVLRFRAETLKIYDPNLEYRMRAYANWKWHLDEVFVKINGEMHYLWGAVDHEAEVLEAFVTKRRDRKAASIFIRKIMKRYGQPAVIVTDRLRSYGAAMKVIGNVGKQQTGRWLNNRAENSRLPFRRRERAMLRFRRMHCRQKFASVHSCVHNHFKQERHLYSRDNFKLNRNAALAEWRQLCSA